MSATFLLVCFLSLNESTCQTRKILFISLQKLFSFSRKSNLTKKAFKIKQKTFFLVSQVLSFTHTKQTNKNVADTILKWFHDKIYYHIYISSSSFKLWANQIPVKSLQERYQNNVHADFTDTIIRSSTSTAFLSHNIIKNVGPNIFHLLKNIGTLKTFFKEPQRHSAFIYSKLTMETPEQYVKSVQS